METCPMCIEEIEYDKYYILNCCKNNIHIDCLIKYIKHMKNTNCPYCMSNEIRLCADLMTYKKIQQILDLDYEYN